MSSTAAAEAEKILFRANEKLAIGNVSEALDILLELVGIYPEFGKAFFVMGNIYSNSFNDFSSAETFYKKAISLSPEFSATYLAYAETLIQQERFTETIAVLNKSLEIPGVKKDKANYLFGVMYELQAKFEDAVNCYKKAIAVTLSEEIIAQCEKAMNRCNLKKKYT